MQILGLTIDNEGRCVHYHSERDIVANKCFQCLTYYACYLCHNAIADHLFKPFPINSAIKMVMCGHCKTEFNYQTYHNQNSCFNCHANFNPNCEKHKDLYFI